MIGALTYVSLVLLVAGLVARQTAKLPRQSEHAAFFDDAGRRIHMVGVLALAAAMALQLLKLG